MRLQGCIELSDLGCAFVARWPEPHNPCAYVAIQENRSISCTQLRLHRCLVAALQRSLEEQALPIPIDGGDGLHAASLAVRDQAAAPGDAARDGDRVPA